MATRPVFISNPKGKVYIEVVNINFEWFAGLSVKQKQRSIASLHSSFLTERPDEQVLEISSKSTEVLGTKLSAFNLSFIYHDRRLSVESSFQASKVFENGGPFHDLLEKSPKEAKHDSRLKSSGALKMFDFFSDLWGLEPKTAFYDWLYINALMQNQSLVDQIVSYTAFTDIEFNPQKSINCQARSAALFVSLYKMGLINGLLLVKENFINTIYK